MLPFFTDPYPNELHSNIVRPTVHVTKVRVLYLTRAGSEIPFGVSFIEKMKKSTFNRSQPLYSGNYTYLRNQILAFTHI